MGHPGVRSPSVEEVQQWIAVAETRVAELANKSDEIQVKLAQARKTLVLYHEILAALTKAPVALSDEELRVARSVRERTVGSAVEILRAHGKPMRIQDIHAQFIRRGHPLPGRGTPTNIVAHLSNTPLLVRCGRGVYALTEWRSPEVELSESIASEPAERQAQ